MSPPIQPTACMMSPSTQPATCIDDLPAEMICEVFKRLNLKDLVTCSLVNKRWHSIYAAFKVHRLAAIDDHPIHGSRYCDYRHEIYFVKWSHPDRMVLEEELCRLAAFVRLAEKPLLSSLRHLALAGVLEFDLNKVNAFGQLVHLEIKMPISSEVPLSLPRLKVLAFYNRNNCALSIDCPQLSFLAYEEPKYRNLLEVKHPETIRKLETNMVGSKLAPFKSVECLVAHSFDAISQATLLSLPALKELRYNESIEMTFNTLNAFDVEYNKHNHVRRTLRKFLDDLQVLRGSDFRFRFSGFPLTKKMLEQIDFGVRLFQTHDEEDSSEDSSYDENDMYEELVSNEYVYLKNQQLIDGPLEFLTRINYTSLIEEEISSGFCEKLTNVQLVKAKRASDASHLLWFLKQLRSLRTLELKQSRLDQQFFDGLPASAHSLTRLALRGGWRATELQLNFDFVTELAHLSRIEIENHLSFDSFRSLAKHFGQLELVSIRFSLNGRKFSVCTNNKVWMVKQADRYLFETEHPSEILSFFKD